MKKILICVVTICFLCAVMIFSINATNLPISDDELEELVCRALDLFYTLDESVLNSPEHKKLDKSFYSNPENYYNIDVTTLPGGSLNGFFDYVKSIYTDEVSQKYYSTAYLHKDSPMFIIDNDGDVFMRNHTSGFPEINCRTFGNAIVEVLDSNDRFATARVQIEKNVGKWDGFVWEATWFECKFENTQNGWRISECELFDILNSHSDYYGYSPLTSDPAFDLVFILPTVSVAALASAFCLMRRRRDLI